VHDNGVDLEVHLLVRGTVLRWPRYHQPIACSWGIVMRYHSIAPPALKHFMYIHALLSLGLRPYDCLFDLQIAMFHFSGRVL
jgi:hypothetical protein